MRVVRPEANSPKVMDHDNLRRTDGQGRPYNIRWHSSREEMWALLIGRHERCGSNSILRSLPGDGIAWRRIAGFVCAPVSHMDPSSGSPSVWNCAAVTLAPDPRRGVVARAAASGSTVGVARLRALSFTWRDRNSYEQLRVTETLGLVAQHCRELRALRLEGLGGGELPEGEGAEAIRAAITSVLERCLDLRVLLVIDCCEYSPTATPGRTYALTHLHVGCFFYFGVTATQLSAWVQQAPNLRHFGATHYQDEDEGIKLLQAATNSHLETLDLTSAPALEEDVEMWAGDDNELRQAVSGLPENLRLTPFGGFESGEQVGRMLSDLRVECNRFDLDVIEPDTGNLEPRLWDWREAVAPHCFT